MRLAYADYWDIHHRKSTRLPNRDYAAAGIYFVTICAAGRDYLFGEIVEGEMILNEFGKLADMTLQWIPNQYPYVRLDTYVVMPNHIHVIFDITDCRGGSRTAPTQQRKSLGGLIGVFKTVSTKWMNEIRNAPGEKIWQRNYHDRIIRNARELQIIRQYITDNSKNWSHDEFHWR